MAILTGAARRMNRSRQILGSAAILGVAAAVAGLGTFANFTDSTTPVASQLQSGVLSISLMDGGAVATVPFAGGTFLAGDSQSHPLDLVNDGDTALASVTLRSSASPSSVLDTDQVNGLQLSVASCSVPWTAAGASYTCGGTTRSFYSGPVILDQQLANPNSLNPGGVDHLLLTATLPGTASGSAFQDVASSLSFVFDGVQRAGTSR